jgi:hypothetical protein
MPSVYGLHMGVGNAAFLGIMGDELIRWLTDALDLTIIDD